MAGVPGRSGGPRQGAGRPKKDITDDVDDARIVGPGNQTPLEFGLMVMNDNELPDKLRMDAARLIIAYIHPKKGESGKKEQAQAQAQAAATGRFGRREPPRLVTSDGKNV